MIKVVVQDRSGAALAFSVVDADTGSVLSPGQGKFSAPVKADQNGNGAAPADALVPLQRVGGAHWSSLYVGSVAVPDPPPGKCYLVLVHPAAGGEPVPSIAPIPVTALPVGPVRGNLAIILN